MSNENENLAQRVARLERENERLRQKVEGETDDQFMDHLVEVSDAGTRTPGGLPSAVAQIPDVHDQEILRQQQDCARALKPYGIPLSAFDPQHQPEDEYGNRQICNDALIAGEAVGRQLGVNPSLAIARLQSAARLSPEELERNVGGPPLVIPLNPRGSTG